MALTDTALRTFKPSDKVYRRSDEKGLYIEVNPNGSRYWRHKYRFYGKEKRMSYGVYPEVSLKEARARRDTSRKLLADGIDPSEHKKQGKLDRESALSNTFQAISLEWYEKQLVTWSAATAKKRLAMLQNDLFPWLGKRPTDEISSLEMLQSLRRIEDRGAIETAHNARQVASQIFRYARLTQRCNHDPIGDLKGALTPKVVTHRAAITDPSHFGELLQAIDHYQGTYIVRCLLALCPILFQRPGEMIAMEWGEIDLEEGQWDIPAKKMKMGIEHTVPLPKQAITILSDLQPLTGGFRYVFSSQRSPRDKHVSDGTINKALRTLGVDTKHEHCAHGFRASARTMLDEQLGFRVEWIEHQLAHQVRDALGRAYNRTKHLSQRSEMMQAWADYLDGLKVKNTGSTQKHIG